MIAPARMKSCIVVGGSGYIGGYLIRDLLARDAADRIYNFDIKEKDFEDPRVRYRRVDVRRPIAEKAEGFDPASDWVVNLAALCREPGSEPHEYFDTNVGGAVTVTDFARSIGCRKLFFTSTMSTYGRMVEPTPEHFPQYPETPYGISKLVGERIHREWLAEDPARRLIICRPGVIFGPGDDQNIRRMIKAVRKGYFIFPGDPGITKAYGYVHGLVESIAFTQAREGERLIIYNYAENPLLSLRGMVAAINGALGTRRPIIRVPMSLLAFAAGAVDAGCRLVGARSPIHPVRVRKVGFATNMQPKYLVDAGFPFKYPFEKALAHWMRTAPQEF